MTVITLTDCPPSLRGDLSKWMQEINTGVFVGKFNARIREELWSRICENIKNGRATMVFTSKNEQGMDFRIHNTTWEPVNYDGIKLIRRPSPQKQLNISTDKQPISKAGQMQKLRKMNAARRKSAMSNDYVIIDVETTGVSVQTDALIELAALRIQNGKVMEEFSQLIQCDRLIPMEIQKLTGITNELLQVEGKSLEETLYKFIDFIGNNRLVGHKISFDYSFIQASCRQVGITMSSHACTDTYTLAKRKVDDIENFKLTTLAQKFGWDTTGAHRALTDCYLTLNLYTKLSE